MSNDYYFCSQCHNLIEAGGDNFCTCAEDPDDYGDWQMHADRDSEAEEINFDEV